MKTEQKAIGIAHKAMADLSELRIARANRQNSHDKAMKELDAAISIKLTEISAAISIALGAATTPGDTKE